AAFVAVGGRGVRWEWAQRAWKIAQSWWGRALWLVGGVGYVGVACCVLVWLRYLGLDVSVRWSLVALITCVIAVDVGAYFTGRAFGGPKIAPSISPSKTWSGLFGGALFASLLIFTIEVYKSIWVEQYRFSYFSESLSHSFKLLLLSLKAGAMVAVAAQAGDFFESWMKRRAGVKDSGSLIPGHGGLFDRVDGLLAVSFLYALEMIFIGILFAVLGLLNGLDS
ncbi:MAG: phosphatidate cytidylyltransferase, partial [Pseudomonadota bacterium]